MLCPDCQAEATPSLAGWLCLNCGKVTAGQEAEAAAKKILAAQSQPAQPAKSTK